MAKFMSQLQRRKKEEEKEEKEENKKDKRQKEDSKLINERRWKTRRRKELAKNLLRAIATAGVIAVASTSPYFLLNLLRVISGESEDKKKERVLTRTLSYLRDKKFIAIEEKEGKVILVLSDNGKRKVREYDFDEMTLPRKRRWDGQWHLVIFDIPHKKKGAREALREKFRDLGMVMLQKSVWVWPYECRDEIHLIQEMFELNGNEVNYIVADYIEEERRLRKHFNL